MIELVTWRCARWAARWDEILRNDRHLAFDEVFLAAHWLVGDESFGHQECVGRDAEAGVVAKGRACKRCRTGGGPRHCSQRTPSDCSLKSRVLPSVRKAAPGRSITP